MPDTQTNAASAPQPMAVPQVQNQTQPVPPAAPGAMPVYNEVTKQYDQVLTQGLTQQTQQQIQNYQPMAVPQLQSSYVPTPTQTVPTANAGETQSLSKESPGTLVIGQQVGSQQTGTGITPVTTQAMTTTEASKREAGIQEVMALNQISYEEAAKKYDTATGNIKIQSVQAPSVMNTETANSISSGLYGDDSGILSTGGYNVSRMELGGVIQKAEQSPLTQVLAESDAMAQALIKANIDEYNRLVSFAAGTTIDPVMQQLIARQARIATQMTAAITDIHAQAESSLKAQEKANREMMGKARAAVNAAGQVGSMVGEGYLASQLQNNLDALQSIKNSEQKAINDARMYFENMQDDLAFKQVELVEKRRLQANELLQQNFQIGKDMEAMKLQRQQAAQQAQLTEMQLRKEGRATAQDFLSTYAKQNLAPEAIPQTVWQTAVQESNGAVTIEGAKAMYIGSLKDQRAKDIQEFNENTKAFYQAAAQIKDPNTILWRPNMDGTFSSVKRSEVQLNPDLESFEVTENGKKYRMYVDKNNLDAAPTKIQIGEDDPKFQYFEDGFGNKWKYDERTDKSTMILDFAGNPAAETDVNDTANFVRNQGHDVTDPSVEDISGGIGSLSSKFESNGNPGAIGYDRTGGLSYGTYQLAHNNAETFVKQSPYAEAFKGIPFNSQAFQQKWKELAKTDPDGFEQAQHDFIMKTHYVPQVQLLESKGIDVENYSPVLKDVVWSTCVQNGPKTNVCANAIKKVGPGASEEEIIRAIYKERWNGGANFASSTPAVKKAVYNRFFGPGGEQEQALKRLHSQQTNVPKDNAMAWAIKAPEDAPVKTNIKNGIVESVEQVGTGKDGNPMMMAMVRDSDTGTLHRFSGMKFSNLQEGMAWGTSMPAPSMGEAGKNGYSEAIYNHDGSPIQPTGELNVEKYGTWGRFKSIPPKVQPNVEKIRNDIESGKIDLDTAVKRVKNDPLLSQVRSDVMLDELGSAAKFYSQQKQQARLVKEEEARSKPATADQEKNAGFAIRVQSSMDIMNSIEPEVTGYSASEYWIERMKPNFLKDPVIQQQEQAESDFISALLRRESGAAIAPSEFDRYQKQYFPQPGDSPQVLEQKRRAREMALRGLVMSSGNALSSDFASQYGTNQSFQSGQQFIDPQTGETFIIE